MHDLKDGGAQRAFVNLANAISAQGIETHLVILDEGLLITCVSDRVKCHRLNKKRVLYSFNEFHKKVSSIKPDYIVTGLLQNNIFICLYKIFFSFPGKIVVSEHSIPSLTDVSSESKLIKLSAQYRSLFYNKADLIIAVSNSSKIDLVQNYKIKNEKITVINNPVINDNFFYSKKATKVNSEFLFVSVGRLHSVKNHSLLLDALSLIKDKINFKLVILGEGPERTNIERKIIELNLVSHVELRGFVIEPFIVIKESDILIVSSKIEGFGNVVVEALACGVPVVSTKCFGPEEILDSEIYGQLCEHNSESMASAILKVSSAYFNEQELIDKSKNYLSSNIAKKYIEALQCLA